MEAAEYRRMATVEESHWWYRATRSLLRQLLIPEICKRGTFSSLRFLDAGCGTGASTAALLEAAPHAEIVAVDASAGMLEQAATKSWPDSVRFVHTPIEALAEAGVAGPFDGILAAYLLRNLADPDAQLRRFAELLRPGATLAVHEYSVADSQAARAIWNAVCWGIIIPAGWRQTRDSTLYRHLWRSVNTFDGASDFQRRLVATGFTGVHSETMPGWQRNIVHTFLGDKPMMGNS